MKKKSKGVVGNAKRKKNQMKRPDIIFRKITSVKVPLRE